MSKQQLVGFFFEKNYMMTPVLLNKIPDSFDFDSFIENNNHIERVDSVIILDENLFSQLVPFGLEEEKEEVQIRSNIVPVVEVISSYQDNPKKREVKDFVLFMKSRYKQIKKILLQRIELQSALSISKALGRAVKEPVSVIGIINSIDQTKNGHYILELEDPTGFIKILISNTKEELIPLMEQIVLDEIIGISGSMGENIIFVNELYFPDMPLKEYKKSKDDVSVAFISDLHIGSKLFAEEEFEKFIEWINCNYGTNEQKELASKVKYLMIAGDLVDGVGIFPGHESELNIKDVYKQYEKLAEYLSAIRKDIKIVLCGGNHDALRLAEPQPPLSQDFARAVYKLNNVINISNPGIVRIHNQFDIMMYHGFSFDYYVNNVTYLRNEGGYNNSLAMMEFVLKKRHISPTHLSTLSIPDIDKDSLVVDHIPDIFVTGHFHYDFKIGSYKNVTLIGSAGFQKKSAYQEKLGHENICYGKTAVINLKTRKSTIIDFNN
ncbi:MAG: metallophosphoesterase [Nanoarchaeota archaeon]|nr:metallophosphoesterase [Nanoarchaeota archaeon]